MDNFFISWIFFATCVGSLIVYYLPFCQKLQAPLLVAVSFAVYWLVAGNLVFLLLFCCVCTAFFSYCVTIAKEQWRKLLMIFGVLLNLSLLIFFKYKHLLLPSALFSNWFGGDPLWLEIYQLTLPIGISFYVFHSISMIVDCYQNPAIVTASNQRFFTHAQKTLLYLVFFPQIVAGPIAKGKFFYAQIVPKHFSNVDWTNALRALVHGYFLKEVIANNLNQLTAPMSHPEMWPHTASSELLLMLIGYSAQIFADFAGYSLIAIGISRLYGYDLPMNFNCPYFAHSFTNFWQRWHMSLSNWLRDYLYIPLGGSRKGLGRTYLNLMIVMALGGLWHGPAWKYATWGIFHGLLLAFERILRKKIEEQETPFIKKALSQVLRIVAVFSCVTFAWLFFRLNSLHEVFAYMKSVLSWQSAYTTYHKGNVLLISLFIGLVFAYHIFGTSKILKRLKRYDGYLAGAMMLLCVIARGKESAFIYFQF